VSEYAYARRRALLVDALTGAGVLTLGSDGLNVWVPVHDESAAIMRLTLHGVAVLPGRPFTVGRTAVSSSG
jgi:DNA-binding transcriptional MocR family regulator